MSSFKSRRPSPPDEQTEQPCSPSAVADENISTMLRMEEETLLKRSLGERVADAVTTVAVKPWFIVCHGIAYAGWMFANTAGGWRFDPIPFNFLNTAITMEAVFITLLVLASQQRMLRQSDRRAHLNLQVDLLAEQEMTVMLRMLERLFKHFKLDPVAAVPQSAELSKTTDLEELVDKLDSRMNDDRG